MIYNVYLSKCKYHQMILWWAVADAEIEKGGYRAWRAKRARKFLGVPRPFSSARRAHAHA